MGQGTGKDACIIVQDLTLSLLYISLVSISLVAAYAACGTAMPDTLPIPPPVDSFMDLFLKVGVAWLCLTSLAVYKQRQTYGHLLISLGAAFVLLTFLLLYYPYIGWASLIAGGALFWAGIAVLFTFERDREHERLRYSSWREIALGIVPEHLQEGKLNKRARVTEGVIISFFFAIFFYQSGDYYLLLSLLVIGFVYAIYLLGGQRGEEKS